jgi:hypothetical protein
LKGRSIHLVPAEDAVDIETGNITIVLACPHDELEDPFVLEGVLGIG